MRRYHAPCVQGRTDSTLKRRVVVDDVTSVIGMASRKVTPWSSKGPQPVVPGDSGADLGG